MTENKFNLSEKRRSWQRETNPTYKEEDVKEFIKELKEAYLYLHEGNRHEKLMLDKIDKLAGDKLI